MKGVAVLVKRTVHTYEILYNNLIMRKLYIQSGIFFIMQSFEPQFP